MSKLLTRRKLGELCSVVTKGTTPTSLGMAFEDEGVPFLRIQNLFGSSVHLKDILYISEDTHNALNRSKIMAGDFLITIAGTIGRVAIVPDDFPEANCNQAVAILRFDKSKLFPRYLLHWLTTNDALQQISGKKVTATISNLSLGQIKELEIPLPPLDEQVHIAAILDKADAIRRKRQQAIQLADDFLRSVFLDMFGDPVTNPKGWEFKKLGELIIKGPTNGLYKPASDYGSGTRILRIDGFYDGVLSDQSKLKRVKVTDAEMEKFGLSERSIVINRVNSKEYLGKCGFAQHIEESTVFESNMMNFKVDEARLNPRFLVQQLQMPNIKMQIATCSKDAVNQSSINQNDVKSFEIIVPTIELQNEYESVCKRFLAFKLNYADSSNFNSELFNSLSQKAFAGEL